MWHLHQTHAGSNSTRPPLELQHRMKNDICPKEAGGEARACSSFCAEVCEIAPFPWNPLLRRPVKRVLPARVARYDQKWSISGSKTLPIKWKSSNRKVHFWQGISLFHYSSRPVLKPCLKAFFFWLHLSVWVIKWAPSSFSDDMHCHPDVYAVKPSPGEWVQTKMWFWSIAKVEQIA